MDIVNPIAVTPDNLTDTNVIWFPDYSLWDSGTTYSTGQQVVLNKFGVAGNTVATIYTSLQNGNLNNAPASSPAWWEVAFTTPSIWGNTNDYNIGDQVVIDIADAEANYDELADGDYDLYQVYESLANTTTESEPPWRSDNWTPVGKVNTFRAFDGATNSPTTWDDEISFEFTPGQFCDTIGMLSMSGVTDVNVTVTVDAVEEYNTDFDLTDGTNVGENYDWYFSPSQSLDGLAVIDFAVQDMPLDPDAVITLTLTGSGSISVGEVVIGQARPLGAAAYGLGLGINDHSRITADEFGVRSLVVRSYAKKMSADVFMDANDTSPVFNLLASFRATPCLAIGSDVHSATIQYGLIRRWEEECFEYSHSRVSIDFEGL